MSECPFLFASADLALCVIGEVGDVPEVLDSAGVEAELAALRLISSASLHHLRRSARD